MGEAFGIERIGFLTLTCGDETPAGFVKVSDRAEASRRYHSLHNIIRSRYGCGVIVTERHKDGGIHFHLVVAVGGDIRTGVDFDACFPPREHGRPVHPPCYDTATPRLKLEWKFWRAAAPHYGFGRHNLQPARKTAEALGYYIGKYISKSWEARCDDDKGGRLVRYFGRWSKEGHKFKPPWYANHGSLTPWARAWRDCAKQVALSCNLQGYHLTEHNVAAINGPRWAWNWTRTFNGHEFFVRGDDKLREAMGEHNGEAAELHGPALRHVGHSGAEWWLRQGDWDEEVTRDEHQSRQENWEACREAREDEQKAEWLRESLQTWPVLGSISGQSAAMSTGSSSNGAK